MSQSIIVRHTHVKHKYKKKTNPNTAGGRIGKYVNHARVLRGFHFYSGRSCRAKMSSVDHGYVPSPAALETSQAQTRFVFARCIPSLVIGACATRSSLYSLTTVSPPPFSFLIPFFAQARTMPSPHLR